MRPKDLPAPEPVSPFQHLDERKAAIYENLRDLQFEYRVGKLSDAGLPEHQEGPAEGTGRSPRRSGQAQAQLDVHGAAAAGRRAKPQAARRKQLGASSAPPAARSSTKTLKFCGECGKPMKVAQ